MRFLPLTLVLLLAPPVRAEGGLRVGAGFGQLFTHFAPGGMSDAKPGIDFGWYPRANLRANQLRIIDETGILMAILGSAGSQYTAREKAVDQAVASGAKAGDTVTYSYDVYEPAPGMLTVLDIGWGKTTGYTKTWGGAAPELELPNEVLDYWNVELTAGLWNWNLGIGHLTLDLGVRWLAYEWQDIGLDEDWTDIDMPIGVTFSRQLLPGVFVLASADIQVLSTLVLSWLADHWLNVTGRAAVEWTPVSFLVLDAHVLAARYTNAALENVAASYWEAGVNAAFVLHLGGD